MKIWRIALWLWWLFLMVMLILRWSEKDTLGVVLYSALAIMAKIDLRESNEGGTAND